MFGKTKQRKGLFHLGTFGGHEWYRLASFDDTVTERYLNYMKLLSQYDSIGMKLSDLKIWAQEALRLSNENKQKDLHTYINYLIGYIDLEHKSDIVFDLVNYFVLIDDEPVEKISFEHIDIKRKAYNESDHIKVFFCELLNIIQNSPESFREGLRIWEYLQSRMVQVSEQVFLNAIKAASSETQKK